MESKKRILIISLLVLIVCITTFLIWYNVFDTTGLIYLSDSEHIVSFDSTGSYTVAVVSDTGNVYINSDRLDDDMNFGLTSNQENIFVKTR